MTSMFLAADSIAGVFPMVGAPAVHQDSNVELVFGLALFMVAGLVIGVGGLTVGRLGRPTRPHPVKGAPYECGEPAIGDSWVQFDLRFYTVALVFIVFDVEVALLWPWAVVFQALGAPAFWAFAVFFMLIAIPFLYEWHSGYLHWVRSSSDRSRSSILASGAEAGGEGATVATTASR